MFLSILAFLEPEHLVELFGSAVSHDATKFGLAFSLAAWIHSGRVRKEIKALGAGIVESVDKVAFALKQDLKVQVERMDRIENGIGQLTTRVTTLETKGKE